MTQDNIIALAGRGEISDPLTELLRSGARQLLCQAVEAELEGFGRLCRTESQPWSCRCCAQWPPSRAGDTNRHWPGEYPRAQGSLEDRTAGDFPLSPCAALHTQEPVTGGGVALALPEGHIQW